MGNRVQKNQNSVRFCLTVWGMACMQICQILTTRYTSCTRKRCTLSSMVCGDGGLVVSALDFQAGYCGFESRSGRDNFQTISTPSSYSTCRGLSIKWTWRRLVTDSGTKCAWVIHGNKAVQIHVHNNRRCLYVPRVPDSVKNPHNIIFHGFNHSLLGLNIFYFKSISWHAYDIYIQWHFNGIGMEATCLLRLANQSWKDNRLSVLPLRPIID